MLLSASRGAGPGPATLASWRLHIGRAILHTSQPTRQARSFAQSRQGCPTSFSDGQSPNKSTSTRSRSIRGRDINLTGDCKRFRATKHSPLRPRQPPGKNAKPHLVASKGSLAKLNRLTALPDDTRALVEVLKEACVARDNRTVVRAWERLRQIDAIDEIRKVDLFSIGSYVAQTFATPWANKLFTQGQYLQLEDMAIEAAAHDEWKGLYSMCLAAIRFGRPERAADAFERYKLRIFKVQGKNRPDGSIRDKSIRMRSRLDGYGPIPLTYTYLLAMMRLNQINGKVIMSVFETRKPIFADSQKMIDHVLAPLLSGLPKTERPVIRREFERLIETATFVLMVWHPQALLRTMRDIDFTQDWVAMRRLYNTFLKLSIGPNKLIHAYDLDVSDQIHYEEVPFTAPIWLRFIGSMKRSGDLKGLQNMLEIEMPMRNLKPTSRILRAFITAFSYIAISADTPKIIRRRAARLAENLWGDIERSGVPIDDNLLSARVESLSMYDPNSVPVLHLQIDNGEFPNAGHGTQTCLIGYYMRKRNSEAALEILKAGIQGRGICKPGISAFACIIRTAALFETGSREIVLEALRLKPAGIRLRAEAVGLLLVHMLHWGYTVKDVIERFKKSIVQGGKLNSIDAWEDCLTSLITRRQERHETTAQEFVVAISILGLPREEQAANVTHYTGQLLWSKIFRRIIASSLPTETRADLLDLCIELFPPPDQLHFIPERFLAIMESALMRPLRDRVLEAETLVQWYIDRGRIFPGERQTVLVNYVLLCVRHGELGLALHMLDEPDFCKPAAQRAARAIISRVTGDRHADSTVLEQLRLALVGRRMANSGGEVEIELDIEDVNARAEDWFVDVDHAAVVDHDLVVDDYN